jgi:hypothetical protein
MMHDDMGAFGTVGGLFVAILELLWMLVKYMFTWNDPDQYNHWLVTKAVIVILGTAGPFIYQFLHILKYSNSLGVMSVISDKQIQRKARKMAKDKIQALRGGIK